MKYVFNIEKLKIASKIVGILCLVSGSLLLNGCGLNQKGMVLFTDPSWRATVVGTADKDGFTVPDGLLWKEGKLYMADEGGGAFRVWTNSGDVKTFCDSNNSGVMSPEDLVLDTQGNAFFTDDDAGGLWEVDNQGKCLELAGKDKGLISTEGIVLSPAGRILVGEGEQHQVYSVTRTGEVSVFLDANYGIKKAESMVYDDKGDLYIADNEDNILYMLTPDMKLHRPLENQPNFSPETIWYSKGVLYITDSQNGKLFSYTPDEGLRTIAVFGGKLATVCGITTDDNGSIYVSIQTNIKKHLGYVLRLDKETQPLAKN